MDRSLQLEELDSLKNIFYDEEFQVLERSEQASNIEAIFWAFFTLPDNYEVKYLKSLDSPEPWSLKVRHLPPIELRLSLPEEYPSKAPPEFVISCQWLDRSKTSALCKKLDDLWTVCGPIEILYCWCDFLKNESLSFLGVDKALDLTYLCTKHLSFIEKLQQSAEKKRLRNINGLRCKQNYLRSEEASNNSKEPEANVSEPLDNDKDCSQPSVTLKVDSLKGLKDNHNSSRQRHPYFRKKYKVKDKNSSPKKANNKFDERAVLNLNLKTSPVKVLENYNTEREKVEFLKSFFTCNICFSDKLGKDCTQFKNCNHVFCISCTRSYFTVRIEDGTVQSIKCPEDKCTSEALPSQVKEIVSAELFAKYDFLLLNTALDTLGDVTYCPRQICQYPVFWEPEEKMASCPNCQYVFCVTCKMVYHGVEPCQYKAGEVQKLVEQYENGSAEDRQQMEMRYGKKRIESLVNNSKAEMWIKENSKACPKCSAAIEKSQGCNKMKCWKCSTPFCWLCCQILNTKDPYSHFRDPKSSCVNKLFHLVPSSDDEDEEDDDWHWVDESDEDFSDPEQFHFDPETGAYRARLDWLF